MKHGSLLRRHSRAFAPLAALILLGAPTGALFARQLEVLGFQPQTGGPGTEVTIQVNGLLLPAVQGFRPELPHPDDFCAVLVRDDGRLIDLEVIQVRATELVAKLGPFDPEADGQPHRVMVACGRGIRQRLLFGGPDNDAIVVGPNDQQAVPVWNWRGDLEGAGEAPDPFTPRFRRIGLYSFHSGPPTPEGLKVVLDRDWGPGMRLCIRARIHKQGTGADTRIGPLTWVLRGDRERCARIICALIQRSFKSHPSRPLDVDCEVVTNPDGTVCIIVSCPDGTRIDQGHIDIVCKRPPPVIRHVWSWFNKGLWRREFRRREIARWYRHYEWVTDTRIWMHRRAEGFWITGAALRSFTCSSHCILQNPRGPGHWRIWRTFTRTDVRRFRKHYRTTWIGHLNPIARLDPQMQNRFAVCIDGVEVVVPMEPEDPNTNTPFNEGVMIFDENGEMHFLGEPGFEGPLPDTEQNIGGFQLLTTAMSTEDLEQNPQDRIRETPMQRDGTMAEIQPGVWVHWITDDDGNVLNQNPAGGEVGVLDALGGGRYAVLPEPTGIGGNELPLNFPVPPQFQCWQLDQNGNVVGVAPGEIVVGPPHADADGNLVGAIGGPIPVEATVRELIELPGGGVQEVRDPTANPSDWALVEEDPPSQAEIDQLNQTIAEQIPGFVPFQGPFTVCFREFRLRRFWGIDRRTVMDVWSHHWTWRFRSHYWLRRHWHRVWMTKAALTQFSSRHHHHVFGQQADWHGFTIQHVRFFRVCYRLVRISPNKVRWRLDELHVVLPVDPENPDGELMLLTTMNNENLLPPPRVLAGLEPDPLEEQAVEGVVVQEIPRQDTADILAGDNRVGDIKPPDRPGMGDFQIDSFFDVFFDITVTDVDPRPNPPCKNSLQLYCMVLNADGTPGGVMAPIGPGGAPTQLTEGFVPAFPMFSDTDEAGTLLRTRFPEKLGFEMAADHELLMLHRQPGSPIFEIDVPPGYSLRLNPGLRGGENRPAVPSLDGIVPINTAGAPDSFFDVFLDPLYDEHP